MAISTAQINYQYLVEGFSYDVNARFPTFDQGAGFAGTTPPDPPFTRGGKKRRNEIGTKAQLVPGQLFTGSGWDQASGSGGVVAPGFEKIRRFW